MIYYTRTVFGSRRFTTYVAVGARSPNMGAYAGEPMIDSILTYHFSEADELWLTTVAQSESFDPRLARVLLYDKLPKDYEPTHIDRRFYEKDKLTVIGQRRFKPDSSLLKNMEATAIAFRKKILDSPGIDKIEINSLCDELGISRLEMQGIISSLQDVAQFFNGMTHAPGSNYVEQVHFSGPSGYDGPLKFTTLDDALERCFRIQSLQPGLRAGNRKISTVRDTDISKSKALRPDKRATAIKKKTAFVIMPIDPSRPELEDILDAIKSVAARFKISAYRADEIEHQDTITNIVLE